ncbi:unnamed protein product [Gordionus sp. m RMFG-2023]
MKVIPPLSNISLTKPMPANKRIKQNEEYLISSESLNATTDILKLIKNPQVQHQIKSEILQKLNDDLKKTEIRKNGQQLTTLFTGMKIDDTKSKKLKTQPIESESISKSGIKNTLTHSNHSQYIVNKMFGSLNAGLSEEPLMQYKNIGELRHKVDLFGSTPLGIFKNLDNAENPNQDKYGMQIWDKLELRELNNYVKQPPINSFEDLIEKTEKGIIWPFPINNELGMEEESNIPFYEHIFVYDYFLNKTQNLPDSNILKLSVIKRFIELVCVGLSKNPNYTVKEKRETIDWYLDYFTEKENIIRTSYEDAPKEKILISS